MDLKEARSIKKNNAIRTSPCFSYEFPKVARGANINEKKELSTVHLQRGKR